MALSWTTPAYERFHQEANDALRWEEDGTTEEDDKKIQLAWINIGDVGRADWEQYVRRTTEDAAETACEIRCVLTLARFMGVPLKEIENGRGRGKWVGFGRWYLRPLSGKDNCVGAVCQAAVRTQRYDEASKKTKWHVISDVYVAKLVDDIDPPLPDVVDELQIHKAMTVAAAAEGCEYVAELRGGGPDRNRNVFTVLTTRAEHGSLQLVLDRHDFSIDVPEAFIWYTINAMAQAALIMERGSVTGCTPQHSWPKEIVHLDIRPANIVLHWPHPKHFRRYPTPKLLDFGTAIATDAKDNQNPYGYAGRGAPAEVAPEMYWADWEARQDHEDRNPLVGGGGGGDDHRLSGKTNIWQIGHLALEMMTCSGCEAHDFDFADDKEPDEPGRPGWWKPHVPDPIPETLPPPDDSVDPDAEPEDDDDGMPDVVDGIDDGEANYVDMGWREPHDRRIGAFSEELTRLVVHMLRFSPVARPNAAAVYTYSRAHMKVWKRRQANQPSRGQHLLLYKDLKE